MAVRMGKERTLLHFTLKVIDYFVRQHINLLHLDIGARFDYLKRPSKETNFDQVWLVHGSCHSFGIQLAPYDVLGLSHALKLSCS